jgi:DNA polymerase III epsilon subunit family exonuclease
VPIPGPPLSSSRLVVFDTETTGLSATGDHVIEIAALALEGGAETGRFESLIDPGAPIPPEISAIHGITDAMVRGRPPFRDVAARFLEFAGADILAAHNAPYDISMMIVPTLAAGLRPGGNRVLDTHRLARKLIPSPRYNLGALAKTLGIEMPVAHRAMADVEACAGLLRACLKALGPEATLESAEEASASRITFGRPPGSPRDLPPRLAPLDEAMRVGRQVVIAYRGGSHGDQPRPITPLFFLELDGELNLSAECHLDHALKNFRVDRIASVRPA